MWTTVESTVMSTTFVTVQPSLSVAAQLQAESSSPSANTDSSGSVVCANKHALRVLMPWQSLVQRPDCLDAVPSHDRGLRGHIFV